MLSNNLAKDSGKLAKSERMGSKVSELEKLWDRERCAERDSDCIKNKLPRSIYTDAHISSLVYIILYIVHLIFVYIYYTLVWSRKVYNAFFLCHRKYVTQVGPYSWYSFIMRMNIIVLRMFWKYSETQGWQYGRRKPNIPP